MDESVSCYGGGAIVATIFGTIVCIALLAIGAWFVYKKYWKIRAGRELVVEDVENIKGDYAFDNPAFKGDNNKTTSPFDNKWKPADKRKTVDDSYAGAPMPRLVPLRGSDFTGLGIEVCGGLKEGIYVKKVMPQGPAIGIVNRGDKITSITIDFRHIVQEDASTILSYASPYNVQLELIEGKGTLPTSLTAAQSPSPQSLMHPLYRSSSQEDLNTIQRNARRKLFTSDDSAYPTLKMDQQQQQQQQQPQQPQKSRSPQHLPVAHEEHEKKNSLKKLQHFIDYVEEKFQTKMSQSHSNDSNNALSRQQSQEAYSPSDKQPVEQRNTMDDGKKAAKFGIRVLPPISDKLSGKSPNKVQADNDNNLNMERTDDIVPILTPPEVSKRNKNKADEQTKKQQSEQMGSDFNRQGSITSSGIRRDAAGIPQEMPSEMMQAALAARDNRKPHVVADKVKSKGKAPRPPMVNDDELDLSTDTVHTNLSLDVTDANNLQSPLYKVHATEKLNFSDNFGDEVLHKGDDTIMAFEHLNKNGKGASNSSTPKSDRKKHGSDTESQIAQGHDSDAELSNGGKLELNSKHITVHQTSEEESDNEGRRTASLGDLSKLEFTTCPSGQRSNNGTLERAQSLEMSDSINQAIAVKATPKKRKAPLNDPADVTDFKEPRLSDVAVNNMEALQQGRLKSAYEWGNLEDAIYDGTKENGNISDTESVENETTRSKLSASSMDMMTEVLAAADKFDKEIKELDFSEISHVVEKEVRNEAFVINCGPAESEPKISADEKKVPNIDYQTNINDTKKFIEMETRNGFYAEKPTNGHPHSPEPSENEHAESVTIAAVKHQIETADENVGEQIDADPSDTNSSDQVKIINYGSNVSDDIKVSRYPFGSLERPKSEVFKKLIAEKITVTDEPNQKVPNGISSTKIVPDNEEHSIETTYTEIGPISLTLGGHVESDLTESSQISPVFSSDGHGVNSISISSTESNVRPEPKPRRQDALAAATTATENVITISTDGSQPSSIIMIDDEKLNFTLQTVQDDEQSQESEPSASVTPPATPPKPTASNIPQPTLFRAGIGKDEVIIIESLSSKKMHQEKPLPRSNGDISPPTKSFVTEIRLHNSRKDQKSPDGHDEAHINENNNQKSNGSNGLNTSANTTMTSLNDSSNHQHADNPIIVETDYIPRNSEIKFTTATYESSPRHVEKRHSHIDQIRSNFERNHNSEIPVPVRKSAPAAAASPTTPTSNVRTSPSKIPVFHSQKSSDNLLKNNGSTNRVSVSVTSIKNSSRNPSGK